MKVAMKLLVEDAIEDAMTEDLDLPFGSATPHPLGGITELLGLEWSGPDIDYASPTTLLVVVLLNAVSIGLSVWVARVVVARLPVDYFTTPEPPLGRPGAVGRNLGGLAVMLLGLVFLVTPGQGTVLILVGLVLTDLPGKRRLERWLASRRKVMSALNWIRRRAGREPLSAPLQPEAAADGEAASR